MKRGPTKHRWRFRGICADAAALGIGREHLYKVLAGNRPGLLLIARYNALKAHQRTAKFALNQQPPNKSTL